MTIVRPFRFEIGAYAMMLPGDAEIVAKVKKPAPGAYQVTSTHWRILLGRFQIFAHLSVEKLDYLKSFIDSSTKRNVETPAIEVNGVPGVTHGAYGPDRTWIDWWFRKGDTTLCLCLQSAEFPTAQPDDRELAEHQAIIASIKYRPDNPSEMPPRPTQ